MKTLFAIFAVLTLGASANAQLVRLDRAPNDWSLGVFPTAGLGDYSTPVTLMVGTQPVHVGTFIGGQTASDLIDITSFDLRGPQYSIGPLFREEYVSIDPYIHGPPLIDFSNPISLVFTNPVEAIGVYIVHTFGALPATFAAGDVEVLAFDGDMKLIGTIFTTATSETYTDTSTWDFLSFATADGTNSIKAITIYKDNSSNEGAFGIGPGVRYDVSATPAPVPEPGTYGILGALALAAGILRKRSRASAT